MKQFESIADAYKTLHSENYQLREHIINLQSRLLDLQGEVPELPENIDLSQPRPEIPIPSPPAPPVPPGAEQSPLDSQQAGPQSNNDDLNSLNRIAVAGLGMRKHPNDDSNYMVNNFDVKRARHDGNQGDASESMKTETHNRAQGA